MQVFGELVMQPYSFLLRTSLNCMPISWIYLSPVQAEQGYSNSGEWLHELVQPLLTIDGGRGFATLYAQTQDVQLHVLCTVNSTKYGQMTIHARDHTLIVYTLDKWRDCLQQKEGGGLLVSPPILQYQFYGLVTIYWETNICGRQCFTVSHKYQVGAFRVCPGIYNSFLSMAICSLNWTVLTIV